MDGIVTILEDRYYQAVKEIWQQLESRCGMTGIRMMPVPHFSWHVAESYAEDRLQKVLAKLCGQARPFTARTAGLGIFTAPKPVLYISLVKDQALMEFHEWLWNQIGDLAQQSSLYYAPTSWVPHITLAYEDLSEREMACCLAQLLHRPFHWELRVDNLALIGQTETSEVDAMPVDSCFRHYFGKVE